jgi:hypothetical protein
MPSGEAGAAPGGRSRWMENAVARSQKRHEEEKCCHKKKREEREEIEIEFLPNPLTCRAISKEIGLSQSAAAQPSLSPVVLFFQSPI